MMSRLSKLVFAFVVAGFCYSQSILADTATAIATSFSDTCALTNTGEVKCWGYGMYGYTPASVSGLSSGISAIAVGNSHACALTSVGGVECWGSNAHGQYGDGKYKNSSVPVTPIGLNSGIIAIAAGDNDTYALTSASGVVGWGQTWGATPASVPGWTSGVVAVSVGIGSEYHVCALMSSGGVECFGVNQFGQLGDGTTTNSSGPVNVTGLSGGVIAIAVGGGFTCALTSADAVKCWGSNVVGQLGDGTNTDSSVPVNVTGLSSGVSAIAAGANHACALMSAGAIKCWGQNDVGQLGNGTSTYSNVPVNVFNSSGMVAITSSADSEYTCALTSIGGVECWGYNQYHQLGNLRTYNGYIPSYVIGFSAAIKNDFDGDGKSDALFLNTTTGGTQYWKSATKSQAVYPGTYDTTYTYAGSGDFNGDGKADIFFTKSSNNGTLYWSGAVKTAATYPGTSAAGFSVAAICDTNGDGMDDIVWLNAATGGTQIWSGAVKASTTYPGAQATGYSVAACADFDGDGKADLFWRNNTTGADEVWLSANKATKLYPGVYPDLTWSVVGAGDIDADGKGDVIWYQATTGKTMVWEGGLKSASTYPGTNATTFTPKAIGDYDGDGKADLLWGNDATLGTQIWPGVVKSAVTYPGTCTAGFSIQK